MTNGKPPKFTSTWKTIPSPQFDARRIYRKKVAPPQREYRARKHPGYNAACFHAQQCAEKYLKARLQEAGIPFPRTHSLPALLQLVLPVEPLWATLSQPLTNLTVYGVSFRYPGANALKADAQQALADCKVVCKTVRPSLGLPV
jgi:HEPN domain-containing protein